MKHRLHIFMTILLAMLTMSIANPVIAQEPSITEITDQAGLVAIANNLAGSYKLGNDITLTDGEGETWNPIGTFDGAFTGTLDGNGFTISGLKVSVDGDAGLFEAIGTSEEPGGIVKNLGVKGTVTSTDSYAGGIAGKNFGTIQNCYTSVEVTVNGTRSYVGAGGIVGNNDGTIQNCYTTGAVTNEKGRAGGIAGYHGSEDGNTIQYCYATGAIKGNQAGGIAGESGDLFTSCGNILNCITLNNSITGTTSVGRIVGSIRQGTLTANYAAPSIPGAWVDDKDGAKKNGIDLTEDNFTGAGATAFASWETANWDFSTAANLPILMGFNANQPVKDVERAPFLEVPVTTIKTQAELAAIKDNLSGSYKLGGNITLTDANGDAWTPIAGAFTGSLDGCGFVISKLKVSVPGKAGLFETIGKGGIVKNLGVTGESVTAASLYAGGYAGGIAGYNEGTIQNCYTNVAVTAASSTDGAGGIVGNNDGTIKNCYTTGAVTNEAGYAGGIAGKNTKDIQYCYATGIIKGSKAGGITGENSLNTRYCIALNGSITGTTSAGRIAGGTSTGVFATNHAAPSIPGAWEDKGDKKMDGIDLTATSFTAAIATAFTGWNDADWDFTTAANLPILMGFKTANQPVKDVARAPFLEVPVTTITTKDQLADIKKDLAGSYKLGGNITLTYVEGETWTPLGEFTGTLDGCGYTISNLNVTAGNNNAGLFLTIGNGGTVKNLGITDGSVTGYGIVGGIAGTNKGTIQNCYTNVKVTANAPWGGGGGIAGENNKGTIKNCYTTGAVTNERGSAGGIAGMSSGNDNFTPIPIQYCYATGVIKGNKAGGIIGQNGSNMGQTLNCIALNDSIIGTGTDTDNAPQVGRIAGATIGTFTANHAAISIPGTWAAAADKGADKKNGADLTENTFTGASATAFTSWNTTTDWDFTTAANLPILKGFKTANQPVKDKKREPFLVVPVTTIKDQAGLAAIASNLSGSYKLGGSFTLTGNWKPLGDNNNRFTGILDGCGYTISGLSVSMTETTDTYAGLFGAIGKDGTVKNLGVTGSVTVTTTGINGYAYAGGIAGLSTGKIMNCYTNVTVDAKGSIYTYAGGIVGYFSNADPAISNCFATGNCTATGTGTDSAAAGGILGGNNGKGAIISYCFATGTIEAKGATEFKYAGGIAGQSGTTMTGCIALNKGITGASGKTNRIAGNHYASTITDCYASPAIPGTWSEIGATKKDGADLTSANFINSNDAFTGWVPNDWRLGDNWQFEDKDFANLPTLLTNGLIPEDIVLAGQTAIKRADCLGLVLIDKAVTYDANLHKDKHLVIAPTGNLTVNTANAQVSSLEIQPDGQVTTTTALGVTKAISTSRTLENQWSTFGAPVAMTFKAIEKAYKLEGYASSEAQRWTRFNLPLSAVSLTAASPNLLAIDKGSETVSFSSDNGTSIPVSAKAESGTTLSNGIFLFRTNPSLSNQTVTNAYILSDDGTRFELQDTAYTLKPFECYVIANAATTKAVQSLRVANGIPTGNDPITLPSDAFRLWEADGQLHLEASQPTDVQVYTLTGTLAHSFRLDGSRTLTLPRGIYLVRSNNITYKVSL